MQIKIVPYNPLWPRIYKEESTFIKNVLKDLVVEIYHIGSTSIEGLSSKPIIDIMPVVKNIDAVDERDDAFEALGYECMGEFGISRRRYYRKEGKISFHIHIFDIYSEKDIIRHLAFRDYLKEHSEEASFYVSLKKSLAKQFPDNIEGYCLGKDGYIKNIEAKAVKWYMEKYIPKK